MDFRDIKKIVPNFTIVKPKAERIHFMSNSNFNTNVQKKQEYEVQLEKEKAIREVEDLDKWEKIVLKGNIN